MGQDEQRPLWNERKRRWEISRHPSPSIVEFVEVRNPETGLWRDPPLVEPELKKGGTK